MNPRKPRATAAQLTAAEALARTLGRSLPEVLESLGLTAAPPRRRARDRRKLKEEGATCKACASWKNTPATHMAFAHHMAMPMCRPCYQAARVSEKARSLSAPPVYDVLPGYRHRWVAVTVEVNGEKILAQEILLTGPQARARAGAALRTARQVAAGRWRAATTTPTGKPSRRTPPSVTVTAELRAHQSDSPLGLWRNGEFVPWAIIQRGSDCAPRNLLRNAGTVSRYWRYIVNDQQKLRGPAFRSWHEAVRERPLCSFCGHNFLWPDPEAESRWLREGRPALSCPSCFANRWVAALAEPAPEPEPAPAAPSLRLEVW